MSRKAEWTLDAARQVVGDVRARTEKAVAEVEKLAAEREQHAEKSQERLAVEQQLRARVSLWVREMEALGVVVKGLWLVDFDNGSGFYCWRWPEQDLDYFHGYDEGFDGRIRIQ